MNRIRLDQEVVKRGLVETRSQAENYIKLGYVEVDGKVILKPGHFVFGNSKIKLNKSEKYVSRGGLKLEAANKKFAINFKNKIVLDAGSSTGGFTDYARQHGSKKIIAIDVGTNQMHPKLRENSKIELHEKTDIRSLRLQNVEGRMQMAEEKKPHSPFVILHSVPDVILADLSFISLRAVLPHLAEIAGSTTQLLVLLKPQFEAAKDQINRGVVKNDKIRRQILRDFENWVQKLFKIVDKADSDVTGEKGNIERFYYLQKIK